MSSCEQKTPKKRSKKNQFTPASISCNRQVGYDNCLRNYTEIYSVILNNSFSSNYFLSVIFFFSAFASIIFWQKRTRVHRKIFLNLVIKEKKRIELFSLLGEIFFNVDVLASAQKIFFWASDVTKKRKLRFHFYFGQIFQFFNLF